METNIIWHRGWTGVKQGVLPNPHHFTMNRELLWGSDHEVAIQIMSGLKKEYSPPLYEHYMKCYIIASDCWEPAFKDNRSKKHMRDWTWRRLKQYNLQLCTSNEQTMEFPWHSCWYEGYPADRNTTFFEGKNKSILNSIRLSKEPWLSDNNLTSCCTVIHPETVISFYTQTDKFKTNISGKIQCPSSPITMHSSFDSH